MTRPAALEPDPSDWMEAAIDQIELLARTRPQFSCDDLRKLISEPPHSGAWGKAFTTAQSRRIISYLWHQRSNTQSRKGGALAVWGAHPSLERKAA